VIVEKITIKFNKLIIDYVEFYKEMVENEIKIANISKDDKVLHAGCGSIPATSILIAKKTGAKTTGIDNNACAVEEALYCLSEIKGSDKVQIKHAEASQFPVETFDVIVVSQGVEPHVEILKYIAQSVKGDARVIFRTNSSAEGELTQNDVFLKNLFNIVKLVSHEEYGLSASALLLKK
jgi:cyclopropane fatty-acyl-phospholipid synthase-like methyltransferase